MCPECKRLSLEDLKAAEYLLILTERYVQMKV